MKDTSCCRSDSSSSHSDLVFVATRSPKSHQSIPPISPRTEIDNAHAGSGGDCGGWGVAVQSSSSVLRDRSPSESGCAGWRASFSARIVTNNHVLPVNPRQSFREIPTLCSVTCCYRRLQSAFHPYTSGWDENPNWPTHSRMTSRTV